MNDPIDWAHRESLRQWRILAARGHEGAMAVVSHQGLAPLSYPGLAPLPAPPAPVPASVGASVSRAPRPVVPAVPQPTPALAGITRRTELLTSLLGARPAVPTDTLI
jgi:hypothetical protein